MAPPKQHSLNISSLTGRTPDLGSFKYFANVGQVGVPGGVYLCSPVCGLSTGNKTHGLWSLLQSKPVKSLISNPKVPFSATQTALCLFHLISMKQAILQVLILNKAESC